MADRAATLCHARSGRSQRQATKKADGDKIPSALI
jgi:hypothetical protein